MAAARHQRPQLQPIPEIVFRSHPGAVAEIEIAVGGANCSAHKRIDLTITHLKLRQRRHVSALRQQRSRALDVCLFSFGYRQNRDAFNHRLAVPALAN